eukprot:330446-Pleurochrysis_carterae.AAC.4
MHLHVAVAAAQRLQREDGGEAGAQDGTHRRRLRKPEQRALHVWHDVRAQRSCEAARVCIWAIAWTDARVISRREVSTTQLAQRGDVPAVCRGGVL